ncbi:MAG: SIS domain-containing protein [Firmicutes bacterium]|nr:SIS domain-containing protein [Bacillota bacterium]
MRPEVQQILDELITGLPRLADCRGSIEEAFRILAGCFAAGGKVLICGNGGSAADSEHMVGELMKGFRLRRPVGEGFISKLNHFFPADAAYLKENLQGALPAIALTSHSAFTSAFSNDLAADMIFAQQVYGYGKEADVVFGISASGLSSNVANAFKIAKTMGLKTIGLTGEGGGVLARLGDVVIKTPSRVTYKVQEYHLPVYHALCAMLEAEFFQ